MKKEIPSLKGIKHQKAKKKYLFLLQLCKKNCSLEDPVYLDRS